MNRFTLLSILVAMTIAVGSASGQVPATPSATPKLGETQIKRSGKIFVQVYLEENFKGKSYRIEVPAELANDARLKELGIPNDSIMSMKIPDGVSITLYDAANFGGMSQTFTGKVASLGSMKGVTSSLKAELKAP